MQSIDINRALVRLKANKRNLTRQQLKTLRGQVLGGDPVGAMRGLQQILMQVHSSAIKTQ